MGLVIESVVQCGLCLAQGEIKMARARINRRITMLIGQCNELIQSGQLNDEQAAHVEQLIAWAGQFAAGCTPNPFRTLGLPSPTDSMYDIDETAGHRLEIVGQTKLTALNLARFPSVAVLAEVLAHRMRSDLQALRAYHEAGTLATYARWHRSRARSLVDMVSSHSATASPGTQAQASGISPRGGSCSDWS